MRLSHLLTISAILEMATGIGLVAIPTAVATLLFSQDLFGPGPVVGRVAGFALVAMGLAFWGARNTEDNDTVAIAMFGYNSLVGAYLALVGFAGGFTGILLWPAVAVHTALALACASLWFKRQLNRA